MDKSTGLVLWDKPYTGSITPTSLVDRSRFGNDGVWTSGTALQLPSGLWVVTYDGSATKIAIGDTGQNAQSVCAWIRPSDVTTRSIIDLDGGTHSIEIDGSGDITATGWASPIFYTAAVAAAVAQTVNVWNFIAVTTTTAFAADNVTLGNEASYFIGDAGLWKIYNRVLTPAQIRTIYNSERRFFGV